MASKSFPDDRTIYTTFNDIFKGPHAAFRKPAPVQKVVHKHTKNPEIASVLRKYGEPAVLDKLRILLAEGVFESTLCARSRFPELFEVSQAQSAERQAWEDAAAKQQAQTLEEAVEEALDNDVGSRDGDSGIDNGCPEDVQVSKPPGEDAAPPPAASSTKSAGTTLKAPSLFPMYLPFATGHRILVKTQSTLEAACFRFASTTIPERCVVEMENNKSMLEARLRRTLEDVAARRAELDRLERAAVAEVLRADAEYQGYAGRDLEESIGQAAGCGGSDVGDASDDGPGLSEGSTSGGGDVDDLGDGPDGCETEGEDDCFEDAQENDSGVFLSVGIPGVAK